MIQGWTSICGIVAVLYLIGNLMFWGAFMASVCVPVFYIINCPLVSEKDSIIMVAIECVVAIFCFSDCDFAPKDSGFIHFGCTSHPCFIRCGFDATMIGAVVEPDGMEEGVGPKRDVQSRRV